MSLDKALLSIGSSIGRPTAEAWGAWAGLTHTQIASTGKRRGSTAGRTLASQKSIMHR